MEVSSLRMAPKSDIFLMANWIVNEKRREITTFLKSRKILRTFDDPCNGRILLLFSRYNANLVAIRSDCVARSPKSDCDWPQANFFFFYGGPQIKRNGKRMKADTSHYVAGHPEFKAFFSVLSGRVMSPSRKQPTLSSGKEKSTSWNLLSKGHWVNNLQAIC